MTKMSRHLGVALVVLGAAACSSQPNVDEVAVGQDVALTRADGGVVEGTVTSRDDTTVRVATGRTTRSVPKDQIVDVRVLDGPGPIELPPAARFREYTVPAGTTLSLHLATAIDSGTNQIGDAVEATLAEAVRVGDAEALPANSAMTGTVSAVAGSGAVKGLASITLRFTSVRAPAGDETYDIDATYSETADATKRADATKIGIGAGAGAAIGGLLGGKSGAAKGAAIGGGAGTAVVLGTKGHEVEHPVGTRLTVTLSRDLDVRVPIT